MDSNLNLLTKYSIGGLSLIFSLFTLGFFPTMAEAQNAEQYIRIAKIVVFPDQLEAYKSALKVEMETSVRIEPGVITLYAVHDKKDPTNITIFEIYAGKDGYEKHIKTPHFLTYKSAVEKMVKSLELVDVDAIALESKSSGTQVLRHSGTPK